MTKIVVPQQKVSNFGVQQFWWDQEYYLLHKKLQGYVPQCLLVPKGIDNGYWVKGLSLDTSVSRKETETKNKSEI